jgi:hypothetical protein
MVSGWTGTTHLFPEGGTRTPMRPLSKVLAAVSIALASAAVPVLAQPATPTPASPIEPAAMKALARMSAYLRSLKAFQVEAVTTDEDVLTDGQKVQYAGTTNLVAQIPGRLRADVTNDRYERLYLYDGQTFTMLAKRPNFYAMAAAPPTITQLADKLERDHGIDMPLVDLFRWAAASTWSTKSMTAAIDLGPSNVEGTTCQQYAFRQGQVDWQIWVQQGSSPLPRKIVITTRTDEARPQHTAVYRWNLAPSFNERTFTFDPPPGSGKIPFAEVRPTTSAKR